MELRPLKQADIPLVHGLLAANGWANRIGSPDAFASLIAASQVAIVAVEENEVVGFIRALTDGLSNGYLSMLVVAASHRRQGIGRALVEQVLGSNPQVTWVLRAGRDGAAEFFATIGFEHSSISMERRRS